MNSKAIGLGLIVFFTLVILSMILYVLTRDKVEVDIVTNCPREPIQNTSRFVFLLDISEEVTFVQRASLKNLIDSKIEDASQYDRFTIFLLEPETDQFSGGITLPVFDRCLPRHPDTVNETTGTRLNFERAFYIGFQQPLNLFFETAIPEGDQDTSPIIEAIHAIAVDETVQDYTKQEVVVVSDLLQNSRNYSHYTEGAINFEYFSQTPFYARVSTPINRSVIYLYYVERFDARGDRQGLNHIAFWESYVKALKPMAFSTHYLR